jgi:hypothetical protein
MREVIARGDNLIKVEVPGEAKELRHQVAEGRRAGMSQQDLDSFEVIGKKLEAVFTDPGDQLPELATADLAEALSLTIRARRQLQDQVAARKAAAAKAAAAAKVAEEKERREKTVSDLLKRLRIEEEKPLEELAEFGVTFTPADPLEVKKPPKRRQPKEDDGFEGKKKGGRPEESRRERLTASCPD